MADKNRLHASARTVYLFYDHRHRSTDEGFATSPVAPWQGAYNMERYVERAPGGRAHYVKIPGAIDRCAWALWHDARAGKWLLGRRCRRAVTKAVLSVYDGAHAHAYAVELRLVQRRHRRHQEGSIKSFRS